MSRIAQYMVAEVSKHNSSVTATIHKSDISTHVRMTSSKAELVNIYFHRSEITGNCEIRVTDNKMQHISIFKLHEHKLQAQIDKIIRHLVIIMEGW